ncbi:MAG: response regulator [Dehalococcoidia bacterium]|jgi:two-component system, cell cycle sensor histidine kinase and response regulator CckA
MSDDASQSGMRTSKAYVSSPAADGAACETHAASSETKTHKILIMDDEDTIRDTVSRMIALFGFGDVATAKEGGEALDIYRKAKVEGAPFDLVIMDLTVTKGIGGREAIKELLKIDPDAKAVVSSGYAGDPLILNFQKYGFVGALVKPYTMDELRNLLRASLV